MGGVSTDIYILRTLSRVETLAKKMVRQRQCVKYWSMLDPNLKSLQFDC